MDSNAMSLFSNLLSNPDAIKNIKDLIGNVDAGANNTDNSPKSQESEFASSKNNDLSFLTDILNQNNSEFLKKINDAYNIYSNNSTPGIKLLEALLPYLSSKRAGNLEKVKTVIKVTNAVSQFNKN